MMILLLITLVFLHSESAKAQPEPAPPGIIADCERETPVSLQELLGLAQSPRVRTMEDFLQSLPPGTLQTYTLMRRSRSALGAGATSLFPRVIRTSLKGKVTIAYGCNPASPSYGQIEIMSQNALGQFEFHKINLPGSRARRASRSMRNLPRIESNPQSCIRCHGDALHQNPDFMHPIWDQYPHWSGAFGERDDVVAAGSSDEAELLTFRQMQAGNPCYNTLPMPTHQVAGEDRVFPYTQRTKPPTLYRRPNLQMSFIFTRDLMYRNFRRLLDATPNREEVLTRLAMAVACRRDSRTSSPLLLGYDPIENARGAKRLLGNPAEFDEGRFENWDLTNNTPLRHVLAESRGFSDDQWSLDISRTGTSFPPGPLAPTNGFTQTASEYVFEDLAQRHQDLRTALATYRTALAAEAPDTATYGTQMNCSNPSFPVRLAQYHASIAAPLCRALLTLKQRLAAQNQSSALPGPSANPGSTPTPHSDSSTRSAISNQTSASTVNGLHLLQTRCAGCHASFRSETELRALLQRERRYLSLVRDRISSENPQLQMPPDRRLNQEEQSAITNYLERL